jgi:hypothetical protein
MCAREAGEVQKGRCERVSSAKIIQFIEFARLAEVDGGFNPTHDIRQELSARLWFSADQRRADVSSSSSRAAESHPGLLSYVPASTTWMSRIRQQTITLIGVLPGVAAA